MADAAPIVSVENVSKVFGRSANGAGGTVALQRVSLHIQPGEFVSLIGPSGCGKSTLLRLVADLTVPTEGTIRVKGKTPRQARIDRDYGMVFQSPVLYDWRTVKRNVQLPLEIMRYPQAERERLAEEMLSLVGLADFRDHRPWQLSGGMQQRVAIARALAFKPSILLMDEPFGALDELTRERMNYELLSIWSRTNTTVIFVTHSIPEAVFLSSRVVVMTPRPGKIEKVIPIDLPPPKGDLRPPEGDLRQPRTFETREQTRFFELVTEVRESLRET